MDKAYIVFDKLRKGKGFWNYFISRRWGHVFMVMDKGAQSIVIETLSCGVYVELVNQRSQDLIHEFIFKLDGTAVIETSVPEVRYIKGFCPKGLITCVSLVKSILQVRDLSITPHGLFKSLKRAGCKVVFEKG